MSAISFNDANFAIPISKYPRSVLYFSDGTMEDSDDESEIDITNLDQIPMENNVITSILSAIDYVGSGLASIFGITSPKYL